MKTSKKKRLERKGWVVGDARDFLGLSDTEAALVELKLDLAERLRELRKSRGISQVMLAKRIQSSQSRVAKMEAGDRSVSIELLLRAILALGATLSPIVDLVVDDCSGQGFSVSIEAVPYEFQRGGNQMMRVRPEHGRDMKHQESA